MALVTYDTPIDWIPDPQYVNHPELTQEYLAWRLSTNEDTGRALWAFEASVDTPTVTLESLLPHEAVPEVVTEEITSKGYVRHFSPKANIATVEVVLEEEGKKHRDKDKKDKDEEEVVEEEVDDTPVEEEGVTVDESNPPQAPAKPDKPVKPGK